MANRFEGMTTEVKGMIFNPANKQFEEFNIFVPYLRGKSKAEKVAREELGVSSDIVVVVTDIINEKKTPIVYDSELVYLQSVATFGTKDDAIDALTDTSEYGGVPSDYEVMSVTMYEISGYVWNRKEHNEFTTEFIHFMTTRNLTKRAISNRIARINQFDLANGMSMATANCVKSEPVKVWCLIRKSTLAECIKVDSNESEDAEI